MTHETSLLVVILMVVSNWFYWITVNSCYFLSYKVMFSLLPVPVIGVSLVYL